MDVNRIQNKHTLLIADHSKMNRSILKDILESSYNIITVSNGAQAAELIHQPAAAIDLLLLGSSLPAMDEFQVLDMMEKYHLTDNIPVILIFPEESTPSFMEYAYQKGVVDYISPPFNPFVIRRRVSNTLALYREKTKPAPSSSGSGCMEGFSRQISPAQLNEKKLESYQHTLQMRLPTAEISYSGLFTEEAITFYYNPSSSSITLSPLSMFQPEFENSNVLPHRYTKTFWGQENLAKIISVVQNASPHCSQIDEELLLLIHGEFRWHRITANAAWSNDDPPRYLGAVGSIADIHEQYLQNTGAPRTKIKVTSAEVAQMIQQMQNVFDVVRLVDVVHTVPVEVDESGDICPSNHSCFSVWNKEHRCENCISAKALAHKTQLTKFEFTDTEIFQVISKYIEIDGTPCVLEMVSKIRDEILLGAYGKDDFIAKITHYNKDLYTDSLTKAYNRRYFEDQIKTLNQIEAVAMIDVDNFKHINDTYGHDVGDLALCCITNAIFSCIRESDMLLRYGGDEFLILFPQIPQNMLSQKMELICENVSHAVIEEYPEIHLSISIGGVHSVQPISEAIRLADKLMYRDKASKSV